MKLLYTSLYDARFSMGGAEKVLLDLALSASRDFGAEVRCAVNGGDLERQLVRAGIHVDRLPWAKGRTPEMLWTLHRILHEFKPDIAHSHHRYTSFVLDLFFKNETKILHTEHVLRQDKSRWFRYGHRATAVHESVRGNLMNVYGVPAQDVVTVPNAVKKLTPILDRVEDLKNSYPDTVNALCIGRFETQKGQGHLVDAVALLPDIQRKRLKIFFAGDGPLEQSISDQVTHRGLQSQFVFLGYVRHVADYLDFCQFLVLPSLWEGMPLVLLEAAVCGRAVIATDIPGSRESVAPGRSGVLVPPADPAALAAALSDFIQSPARVAAMGKTARSFSQEEFSYPAMMKRYWDVYLNLAAEKK